MTETLFLHPNLMRDYFYLKDSRGITIGGFKTEAEAQKWCDEMGYRMRLVK